jgi:hypothetical protein
MKMESIRSRKGGSRYSVQYGHQKLKFKYKLTTRKIIFCKVLIALAFLLSPIDKLTAQDRDPRVVVGGTFMLKCKDENQTRGNYLVSSYIPNGSVVFARGSKKINWYRLPNEPPIEQKYFEVVTSFGKKGYILESETEKLLKYPGKWLFPRTKIFIYRIRSKVSYQENNEPRELVETTKELVNDFNEGKLTEKSLVELSSTYPKDKKPLKVNRLSENQDFYEVEAAFLGEGVRGYVLTEDVSKGKVVIINSNRIESYELNWNSFSEELKDFITKISPNIAQKIDKLSELVTGLEFCKTVFEVKVEGHVGADLWWTSAKMGVEGKLEIKPKNRTYRYSSADIRNGINKRMEIEIMKHIQCDEDRILWPILIKLNFGNEIVLEIHRNNLTKLTGFRNFGDIIEKNQVGTLLTIKTYNQWLEAFQHFTKELKPWHGQIGGYLPIIADLLVDVMAFYPPSELRKSEG